MQKRSKDNYQKFANHQDLEKCVKKKFPWVCPVSILQNIFIATIKQPNQKQISFLLHSKLPQEEGKKNPEKNSQMKLKVQKEEKNLH